MIQVRLDDGEANNKQHKTNHGPIRTPINPPKAAFERIDGKFSNF